MTLEEAIKARHSVRNYKHQPLIEELTGVLQQKIDECNSIGNLHIQLVTNEKKAFSGIVLYGVFSGVENTTWSWQDERLLPSAIIWRLRD